MSGVCDPYQPLEKKYELTRNCLRILIEYSWPVTIQTKSPLVIRDAELLKKSKESEIGLSIATANEKIKELFEPKSPSIKQRIETLKKLHSIGIKTFAMIAPILPKAEELINQLSGKVDYILIDKTNYYYANQIYKNNLLEYAKTSNFFEEKKKELAEALKKEDIPHSFLY